MNWPAAARIFRCGSAFENHSFLTNFDGAELDAVFDGDAAHAMPRSVTHVRRYGVVGAPSRARAMITLFKVVSPVVAKTFDLAEEAQARAWINRPPASARSYLNSAQKR